MEKSYSVKFTSAVSDLIDHNIKFETNKPLSQIVRWKIGGPADIYIAPKSVPEIQRVINIAQNHDLPFFILGDGSNMLIDSNGYRGMVIHISRSLSEISVDGCNVKCGAGAWVPALALKLPRIGLGGIEHVVGIPGTIGGLVLMNGGSQRRGIGENVLSIKAVSPNGKIVEFNKECLNFSYRSSILQSMPGYVVTEVLLSLKNRDASSSRREMLDILRSRKSRFPKKLPNCGSTFLSNPKMYDVIGPPGRAIEDCGLKGFKVGGAEVSSQHANFIVNSNNASSNDILKLVSYIRHTVFKKTGYMMDCEARFLREDGAEGALHEFCNEISIDTLKP